MLGDISNKQIHGFADGSYCSNQTTGRYVCGTIDGPWGLTAFNNSLYISSFGSDQILIFSILNGKFIHAFGDSDTLDCPEGIAIHTESNYIYINNYGSNKIAVYNLHNYQFLYYFATGTSIPHLRGPESLIIDIQRNILAVTSYLNNSILFFDITTTHNNSKSNNNIPNITTTFHNMTTTTTTTTNNNNTALPTTLHQNSKSQPSSSYQVVSLTAYNLIGPIGLCLLPSTGTYVASYYHVS